LHIQTEFTFKFIIIIIITLLKEWAFAVADIMFKWLANTSHLQWRRAWYDRGTKTRFECGFRLSFYFLSRCQACI